MTRATAIAQTPPTTTKAPRTSASSGRARGIAERDDENAEGRAADAGTGVPVGSAEAGENRHEQSERDGEYRVGRGKRADHGHHRAGGGEGGERGGTSAVGPTLVGEGAAEPGQAHPGAAAQAENVIDRERRDGGDGGPKAGRVRGSSARERRRRADVGQRAAEGRQGRGGAAYGRSTRAITRPASLRRTA